MIKYRIAVLAGIIIALVFSGVAYGQGDLSCDDFTFQEEAQFTLDQDPSDPHGLDGNDEDGIACEGNPSGVGQECSQDGEVSGYLLCDSGTFRLRGSDTPSAPDDEPPPVAQPELPLTSGSSAPKLVLWGAGILILGTIGYVFAWWLNRRKLQRILRNEP
jgi:hypothetical protein